MIPDELIPHFTRDFSDPYELYRAGKEVDNFPGEGSYALAVLRALKYYHLNFRQFFYEPLRSRDELHELAITRDILDERGISAYVSDHASISFRCFQSAYSAPLGVLPLPTAGDTEIAAHCVAMSGYDAERGVAFANSWGRRWGDQGFGWLTPSYFDQYVIDIWAARNARYGWTVEKYTRLKERNPSERDIARLWLAENPRWKARIRHRGIRHTAVLYDVISHTSRPAEVIDILDPRGIRVAWAHLFHLPPDGEGALTVAKEFFVWPRWRRMGYGTLLESISAERARDFQSNRLEIYLHRMDGELKARRAARFFAEGLGYRCLWRNSIRPLLAGTVYRDLPPTG